MTDRQTDTGPWHILRCEYASYSKNDVRRTVFSRIAMFTIPEMSLSDSLTTDCCFRLPLSLPPLLLQTVLHAAVPQHHLTVTSCNLTAKGHSSSSVNAILAIFELLALIHFNGDKIKLECGPMPNLMVALSNIGGALWSTPQSLADAHCLTGVQ